MNGISHNLTLPPLIALVGPTAVGKTSLSITLAESFDLEIVSADSRLFYRGMDIGTAKPSREERKRIPHHLIDVTTPDRPWSLADFRDAADQAIESIHQRNKCPLIVGGTGQYVLALLEGWQPPPRESSSAYRHKLKQFVDQYGPEKLHERLAEVDPDSATRIDYRNVRRVIRALEIFKVTGKTASEQRRKDPPSYRILRIGLTLPRDELYQRIDERIQNMLESGWEGEVRDLLSHGYDFKTSPFSAIGYRQLAQYIDGDLTLDEAVREIKKLTRQFVRRQANWFKQDDPLIHWFLNRESALEEISTLIQEWSSVLSNSLKE